jgi:hypothetical protein
VNTLKKIRGYKKACIDGALLAAFTFCTSFSAVLGVSGLGALKTDLTGAILTAALTAAASFFGRLIAR